MEIKQIKEHTVPKPLHINERATSERIDKSGDDPGKVLGIIGLIVAFTGINILGLILSIIGNNKSKEAGYKNSIAIVGIWLNSIFMVFVSIGLLASITIVSYTGVTQKAKTAQASSYASSVESVAEVYMAETENYPDEISDFSTYSSTIAMPEGVVLLGSFSELNELNGNMSIVYQYTGEFGKASGGKIGYWDFVNNKLSESPIYIGDAKSDSVFKSI